MSQDAGVVVMMAGRPSKTEPRGKSPREGQEIGIREIPLGDLWLSVGNITEALSYYKRALSRTADADTEVRVAVARRILECLKRRGKLEDALTFIDSIEPGFEMPARTWLLTEKAKVLCRIGRYGEAASICEKVSKLGSSWENAELYLVMGQVMARTCRWREAITAFEHAAATAAMHGDRGTVGKAFNNLGIAYKNLCRFDESVRYLTKAVEIDRELRDEASLAVKLLNLAITRYKQGDLGATDQAIDECLSLAEQLGMVRIARLAKICKARLELEKGNSECARDLVGEIVSVREEIDVRTRAIAEEVRADIYAARGATASAIARLKAAIGLAPGEAKDVQAEAMSRLGAVYLQANRPKEAHVWAKRSLEVANRIGDLYEAARSLRTLARILPGRQGRDALDRAESLFRRMKARLELAITLHERARIRGIEAKMAIAYLKRAILLYRSCSALRRRIEALCDLALAYGSLKQFERALTCLAEAEDLSKGCAAMKARVSSARTRIDRQVARSISVRT
ncbi:MAG TPA: tetratricopeptide repeat protein, partial [Firmicutes bacterium]|nr:tetratricopeptide repeat protein [Bacillota bacterium]